MINQPLDKKIKFRNLTAVEHPNEEIGYGILEGTSVCSAMGFSMLEVDVVKQAMQKLQKRIKELGCDSEIDIIKDEFGDGDVIVCGEYVIRKSNGERVLRLCGMCTERNKLIDKAFQEEIGEELL